MLRTKIIATFTIHPINRRHHLFEERGYEFMDEMQRWFDILRFDKGTEILGNKGWTEKFRYFPIDQSEMDRAKGGLTQNPGWL